LPGPVSTGLITATAPSRICDNGGWTDTWFARHGRVLNLAVLPGAHVRLAVRRFAGGDRVSWRTPPTPLLRAALQSVSIPDDIAIDIDVTSDMPPGASTGTSAAVTVALLGALSQIARLKPGSTSPAVVLPGFSLASQHRYAIARAAHRVETEFLHQQCGIQDQIASAFGGISYIEMDEYPQARVTPLPVSDDVRDELQRRLLLVYLGASHQSSDVHEAVIAALSDEGSASAELEALRLAADAARDALVAGDLEAFGRALTANTDAQGRLHPDIVSDDARQVIEIARRLGAAGWKVNGAGGRGGSVSILCRASTRDIMREIEAASSLYREIPIQLTASGLRVDVC